MGLVAFGCDLDTDSNRAMPTAHDPDPPIPGSFDSLHFFRCFFSPISFLSCVFTFFSRDFRGSAKRRTLAFFGVSLVFFPRKKQGLGQGKRPKHKPCEIKARFCSPFVSVASQASSKKVPKGGQFHTAICVTPAGGAGMCRGEGAPRPHLP